MNSTSHGRSLAGDVSSDLRKLVYISQGNVPSRKAHTTQACRMAEAFTDHVPIVELITQRQIRPRLFGTRIKDASSWYGLSSKLEVRRIASSSRCICDNEGFIDHVPRRFAKLAAMYCRYRSPQLVYTRLLPAAIRTIQLQIPTILETHDPPSHNEALFSKLAGLSRTPSFRGLVTVAPKLADMFESRGISRSKMLVAPDAADTRPFDEANANHTSRLTKSRFTVGYCGHFYPGRGIETLLACARELPNIDFRLIGGYPEDIAKYEELSRDLSNVTYAGFIPNREVPRRLVECDLLCMPYTAACPIIDWISPMKMFEYMAAKRAIVASDLPAMREVLTHEGNALLCSPDSAEEWIQAIKRLHASPQLRRQLAQNARHDVSQYTWTKRAEEILKWQKSIADEPSLMNVSDLAA